MIIQDITDKSKDLKIYESRCIEDRYAELVIYNEELDQWIDILEEFLGAVAKPAGVNPSKDQSMVAYEFGGIFENQTLFQKNYDNITAIAMLWPWQNGEQVTLKIAIIEKKRSP